MRSFRWVLHPQLVICAVVLCLVVGGWEGYARPRPVLHSQNGFQPAVKGAATSIRPSADCALHPCIALTFDDGPDKKITPEVLAVLAKYRAHATFFVVGREVPGKEALVRQIYAQGHEIGNHSWDHPDFTTLNPADMYGQIDRTRSAIVRAGIPPPVVFRPPYGASNQAVQSHVPLALIRWDVDTDDWHSRNPDMIRHRLMEGVRPGSIILMHDIYAETAAALEPILEQLSQSYSLVTVSQLLALQPGDTGQYSRRR